MASYRNIYFHGKIPVLKGGDVIYYTGKIISNASKSPTFLQEYDPSQDLYLPCGSCAEKKYSSLIKKDKNEKRKFKEN